MFWKFGTSNLHPAGEEDGAQANVEEREGENKHEQVDIGDKEARGGVGCGTELDGLAATFIDEPVEQITDEPADETEKGSAKDVTRIVDSEVDARIAVHRCPQEEGESEQTTAHGEGTKEKDCKSVGRMTGNKTVGTTRVAANGVYHALKRGGVGGPRTVEEGLQEAAAQLVGQQNGQGQGQGETEKLSPAASLQHDVEEDKQKGYPRLSLCDGPHKTIPPVALTAIEQEEEAAVQEVE